MRNLFLVDRCVESLSFDEFKHGINELNTIDKLKSDTFNKGPRADHYAHYSRLYQEYCQENQALAKFIEQLRLCDQDIQTDEAANVYCNSPINGFLGIDFTSSELPLVKQIGSQTTYETWCQVNSTKLQLLQASIGPSFIEKSCLREFLELSEERQDSIIDLFNRARGRNLMSAFYPDTKIIKDVTQTKFKFHLRELRVYAPVALRLYFHESPVKVVLAGISLKSSTNQNFEIVKMYNRIKNEPIT
jgi:hypothetical protein